MAFTRIESLSFVTRHTFQIPRREVLQSSDQIGLSCEDSRRKLHGVLRVFASFPNIEGVVFSKRIKDQELGLSIIFAGLGTHPVKQVVDSTVDNPAEELKKNLRKFKKLGGLWVDSGSWPIVTSFEDTVRKIKNNFDINGEKIVGVWYFDDQQ